MTRSRSKKKKSQKEIPKDNEEYTLWELQRLLKEKHKRLCHEYIRNGWNKTRAYMKLYKRASEDTAGVNASRLLGKTRMKQYIAFVKDDYEMLCGISKASQVKEYRKIAYGNIAEIHNSWITLKDFEDIKRNNPDVTAAIESIDTKIMTKVIDKELYSIEYVKVKFHSKVQALARIDKLMDYEAAEKIKVDNDTTVNLGTGSVDAIRLAFQLDKLKNPTKNGKD